MHNKKTLLEDHFFSPRNIGTLDISQPDILQVSNTGSLFNEQIHLYLQYDAQANIIQVRFKAHARPALIAVLSYLSEQILGYSLVKLNNINWDELLIPLAIPEDKVSCKQLVQMLMQAMYEKYMAKKAEL